MRAIAIAEIQSLQVFLVKNMLTASGFLINVKQLQEFRDSYHVERI